jgi:hypothetical protein
VTDRAVRLDTSPQRIDGVEVVLTDRISVLSGRVTNGRGQADLLAPVVVFSRDRDRWYDQSRFLRLTQTGDDGRYTVEGLPFGSYYVIAPTELPANGADAWRDPAFLETAARRATSVTVREDERVNVDLRRVSP